MVEIDSRRTDGQNEDHEKGLHGAFVPSRTHPSRTQCAAATIARHLHQDTKLMGVIYGKCRVVSDVEEPEERPNLSNDNNTPSAEVSGDHHRQHTHRFVRSRNLKIGRNLRIRLITTRN